VVGRCGKTWVLVQALIGTLMLDRAGGGVGQAPLAATRFLVDSVPVAQPLHSGGHAGADRDRVPWWRVGKRLARFLELLERLERRDRARMLAGPLPGGGVR